MPRTTPEEAFAEARAAMERGDWDSAARFLIGDDTAARSFTALCGEHGVPEQAVVALRALLQRMAESGRATAALAGTSEPAAMLVDEYRKALKGMLKAVPELSRFTASLERATRAAAGGGSVSSRLFVDEILEDVSISGTKAWATRRDASGRTEDVGFVRRKGEARRRSMKGVT